MSVETEEVPELEEESEPEQEKEELPQQAPLVDFTYNDKPQKAYRKFKFKIPDTVQTHERRFLEDVDTVRYGPIKREVTKVLRCRAPDENGKTQEYLYYFEKWTGKDYLGNELIVSEHEEGRYEDVIPQYGVDEKGRPKRSEPTIKSKIMRYYIPFKKSTLDKILKDVDEKDDMIYCVKIGSGKHGGETRRDDSFNYHQFANATYTELITLSYQAGGPRMTPNAPPFVKK